MRILIYFFTSFIFFACVEQVEEPVRPKPVETKIKTSVDDELTEKDFGFNPDHPNTEHYNRMLNNYHEEFIPTEMDWVEWKGIGKVQERFSFRTSESESQLYLIFCATQEDCISVCSLNFEPTTDSMMWGVNGAVAFVVMNSDQGEMYNLLGYLAGEE